MREPSLTPQTWCRRIWSALYEQRRPARGAGDFALLLAYVIQLHPSEPEFDDLLATCAADLTRPGLAASALALATSWDQARGSVAPTPPPLAETLRTLGARLDAAGAGGAALYVDAQRMQIQFLGERSIIELGLAELRREIAIYRALRGQVAADDSSGTARFETRLRTVGIVLDGQPAQAFTLTVTPETIAVQGSAGYDRTFTAADIVALEQAAAERRQAPTAC